jgi:hypothetical protein
MEERELILQVNLTSGKQNVMQIIVLRFYIKNTFRKELPHHEEKKMYGDLSLSFQDQLIS